VTELELGAELENSQYIGPYPPGGVHTYEVMIFALKNSPDSYEGYFDNSNPSLDKLLKLLILPEEQPATYLQEEF